jgi:hypothetical protein
MKTLVEGYMVSRYDHTANKVYETLYAVTNTGTVYSTNEREFSIVFGGKGTTWNQASIDPCQRESMQFIGNYKITI